MVPSAYTRPSPFLPYPDCITFHDFLERILKPFKTRRERKQRILALLPLSLIVVVLISTRQILIIDGHEFKSNPAGVMVHVQKFLEVHVYDYSRKLRYRRAVRWSRVLLQQTAQVQARSVMITCMTTADSSGTGAQCDDHVYDYSRQPRYRGAVWWSRVWLQQTAQIQARSVVITCMTTADSPDTGAQCGDHVYDYSRQPRYRRAVWWSRVWLQQTAQVQARSAVITCMTTADSSGTVRWSRGVHSDTYSREVKLLGNCFLVSNTSPFS